MSVPSLPGYAAASVSLADPPGSSVIVAALSWLEGTLLGSAATIVAVIAIAVLGLMMLTGRLNVRQGLTALLGSFILFGAPNIAAGFHRAVSGSEQVAVAEFAPPPPPPVVAPLPGGYDPYASASVPAQ